MCYLLDRIMGIEKHERITEDAVAGLLEEAVQTSYRRGGEAVSIMDKVSKQTVKNVSHVLSSRMSTNALGWSLKGADKMAQLRAYYLNGGKYVRACTISKGEVFLVESDCKFTQPFLYIIVLIIITTCYNVNVKRASPIDG